MATTACEINWIGEAAPSGLWQWTATVNGHKLTVRECVKAGLTYDAYFDGGFESNHRRSHKARERLAHLAYYTFRVTQ